MFAGKRSIKKSEEIKNKVVKIKKHFQNNKNILQVDLMNSARSLLTGVVIHYDIGSKPPSIPAELAKDTLIYLKPRFCLPKEKILKNIIHYVYDLIVEKLTEEKVPLGIKQLRDEVNKKHVPLDYLFEKLKKIALEHSGKKDMWYLFMAINNTDEHAEMLYSVFKETSHFSDLSVDQSPSYKKLKDLWEKFYYITQKPDLNL